MTDVFGRAGREWISHLDLSPGDRIIVDTLLWEIDHTSETVGKLERELLRQLESSLEYQALNSLAGFGPVTSSTFLAEVGDVWRFRRARHTCCPIWVSCPGCAPPEAGHALGG